MFDREQRMAAFVELRKTVRKDIKNNDIPGVLTELESFTEKFGFEDIRNDLAIIVGQYNETTENDLIKGIVNTSDARIANNECRNSILNGILPKIKKACEEADKSIFSKSDKISLNSAYLCNRQKQNNNFQIRDKSQKIHVFFIHGARGHGHECLIQRFYNHVNKRNTARPVLIDLSRTVKCTFRSELLKKIFLEFNGGNDSRQSLIEQTLGKIYSNSLLKRSTSQNNSVFIKIDLPSSAFSDLPIEDIQWFCKDFCNVETLPDDAPTFYFFFSIAYRRVRKKNTDKKMGRWEKWKKNREESRLGKHKNHIVERVKQLPISLIEELTWVKVGDVEDWVSTYSGKGPYEQDQLMEQEFQKLCHSERHYYMEDLIKPFKKIINARLNS